MLLQRGSSGSCGHFQPTRMHHPNENRPGSSFRLPLFPSNPLHHIITVVIPIGDPGPPNPRCRHPVRASSAMIVVLKNPWSPKAEGSDRDLCSQELANLAKIESEEDISMGGDASDLRIDAPRCSLSMSTGI